MDGKRLLILAIFGILGIVALEGIMAHANGTVVAKVERDRQVWRQTAEACLAVIRATGQPPRSWEALPPIPDGGMPWKDVRRRVALDFRYQVKDLQTSAEARQAWITLTRPSPLDLGPERERLAKDLQDLPPRP